MSSPRLLILGILRKDPCHGYDLRRTLVKAHAEEWADIAYGSIYHALTAMTKEGLLTASVAKHSGEGPPRITYRITEAGEKEFQRMLREQWEQPKPLIEPLQVPIAFLAELPFQERQAVLLTRRERVEEEIAHLETLLEQAGRAAGANNLRLSLAYSRALLEWLNDTLDSVM